MKLRTVTITTLLALFPVLPVLAEEPEQQSAPTTYPEFFEQNAIAVPSPDDLGPLFEAMADRRHVLLGESTHGTHEFYKWRDRISRHLISEEGFRFVAVEGDWQAIYRFNEYVKHRTDEDIDARTIMRNNITRWPQWMWANEDWAEFIEWLREFNADLPEDERAGVYGIDMQDPFDSMDAVLVWFAENDPENLEAVQESYEPFRNNDDGFVTYARQLAQGGPQLDEEIAAPAELLRARIAAGDSDVETWSIKQNALAIKRAEGQYRAMLVQGGGSWNARATYMHEAFQRLAERYGPESRGIGWAHNTHVGDSNYTNMSARGEVNIGHLMRQSQGENGVFILGFSKSTGQVVAGREWGASMSVMDIVAPRPGTFESQIRATEPETPVLYIFDENSRGDAFLNPGMQRAIGVVYNPPNEAWVPSILTRRYDALIHFEETTPLTPVVSGE
ncbi:MAG: erythromycin esterase family protein [Candidatus Sumerlaeia bacterium]|nr:erythromycin esterase family protein [Candidatus Sumerlaeia bacterium]